MYICTLALICGGVLQSPVTLSSWEFDSPAELDAWRPNNHLAEVRVEEGAVRARAVDWDPSFHLRELDLPASPWQCVEVRMKASAPGTGALFWSGTFQGEHGGLTEAKKVSFAVPGSNSWEVIRLLPFWQTEDRIRQVRLDVYEGAEFAIDYVRVVDYSGEEAPAEGKRAWGGEEISQWRAMGGEGLRWAPPLKTNVDDALWVCIEATAERDVAGSVVWAARDARGMHSEAFTIRGDGERRTYNIEMAGLGDWRSPLVAFGLGLSDWEAVDVHAVRLAESPGGPPELRVDYAGFVNWPNRAGRSCEMMVRLVNDGGGAASLEGCELRAPDGIRVTAEPEMTSFESLDRGEYADFVWQLAAEEAGEYELAVSFAGGDAPADAEFAVTFSAPLGLAPVEYVPEPQPIPPVVDVCAFYFPGWPNYSKWRCIQDVAPIRKPVLGYYDEANPEVVDWQIKWAVENGISCFFVDWYWRQGARHLEHWFEAYKEARYRDYLDVAIMWANHLPAGSHTMEDWERVTQHWIDAYFGMETYYRVDGRPVIILWSPENLRRDLGGADEVRKAFEMSQRMAREAGYDGISFVAMGYSFGEVRAKELEYEGYVAMTTYHEWGDAPNISEEPPRKRFSDVAATVEQAWSRKEAQSGNLAYWPVVDTGWDSRPWHGEKGLVIHGRNAGLFEQMLRKARRFCEEHGKERVVLAPVNEWGEGSYIEPCTEYGFDMYHAVRDVFGERPFEGRLAMAPVDVGLGPYDLAEPAQATAWSFEDGTEGWTASMGIADLRGEEGALRFRTATDDPALAVFLGDLRASVWGKLRIRMAVEGGGAETRGQVFWASGRAAVSEAASEGFAITADGEMREYVLELGKNPRWRGNIAMVRFDPCALADAEVRVEEVAFEK